MSTQSYFIVGVIVVVCAGIIYLFVKDKPDSASDGDPMPIGTRRLLAAYLLLVGLVLLLSLWQIGTVDFSIAAVNVESKPITDPSASCSTATAPAVPNTTTSDASTGDKRPVLGGLFTQVSVGAVPVMYITACGHDFTSASKIRFNQKEQPTIFVDPTRIQAQLDQATIDALDPISVDVITKESTNISGTFAMSVRKGRLQANLYIWHPTLTRELQLLLLAMLAGALGSFVHALKSFSDFVGNRTLTASWFWWYITRPFLGAALAVIFYAVLRGGFMAGTAADAKAVNQFGVIAVGALVGMFADKATDKLAEIFDTLFKGSDTRGGKLAAPVIDKLDPDNFTVGAASGTFKIKGDRLAGVKQVKFDGIEHPHGTPSDKEISVDLTANDLSQKKTFKVSVSGDNGESPTKDLEIK